MKLRNMTVKQMNDKIKLKQLSSSSGRGIAFDGFEGEERKTSKIGEIIEAGAEKISRRVMKKVKGGPFKGMEIKSKGFDFEPEVTAKVLRKGIRIYEVPISYAGREADEGKKISWKDAIPALWALVKYRFVR